MRSFHRQVVQWPQEGGERALCNGRHGNLAGIIIVIVEKSKLPRERVYGRDREEQHC